MKRLSRTKIEYGDLNWSFYPGCKHGNDVCPVNAHCWANAMSKRQKWDFHQPHLIPELLLAPLSIRKPSTILVNFMGDLFGDWVNRHEEVFLQDPITGYLEGRQLWWWVMEVMRLCPQHTFLFLTKNPSGLIPWSPFPDNAFVGVSACNQPMFDKAIIYLSKVQAKHKWLSFEPLLEEIKIKPADLEGISWIVLGSQSQPVKYPEIEWVRSIVEAADQSGVRVWLKKNLNPLFNDKTTIRDKWVFSRTNFMRGELYRQELPW